MTPRQVMAFVRRHGVVLASAHGPVPSLAEAVAGGPIRGSWWAHPRSHAIFAALGVVRDSPDVLTCRVVGGKLTFVHRRLWPALVRVGARFPGRRLAWVREEHGRMGRHVTHEQPFPDWVPEIVQAESSRLMERQALELLGPWAR